MTRILTLVALGAAAALVPAPAYADHLCVTSGGDEVYCVRHVYIAGPNQICVTSGGQDLVCVF